MREKRRKSVILLALLLVAVFIFMGMADSIQTNNGNVKVTEEVMSTDVGDLTYKLYVPETATADTPAPGVLLLHGYQNDHETCAAYAIELARRGAVVMALDEYGHGSSEPGLIERGYVNHKVTVNFGEDSQEDGTYVQIGSNTASRYRLMMNFSNLSFFDDYYTTDEEGNSIKDSSAGGIAAYAVLADMDCVDNTNLGLSGHSMGTWSSWTVAAAYSGSVNEAGESIAPKAVVLQCGELFRESAYDSENIKFNNVLLLQAKYDEFSYFRDYKNMVTDELLQTDLRTEFLGCTAEEAAWDTTYGNFADGSARRMELLYTNHRLATHDSHGLTAAMEWFDQAMNLDTELEASDLVAMKKEMLVLAAMICTLIAMIPFMELLLTAGFFQYVARPLPPLVLKKKGAWWRGAIITMLLAGASYPFMTQLGHGLLPVPETVFRMTVGNGFLSWYLLLIVIMLATVVIGRVRDRKKGKVTSYYQMGFSTAEKADKIDGQLMGRGALLALAMVGFVYVITAACQAVFLLDLRFIWPFFKTFTPARLGQFFVYIWIYALFYLLNNSKIFAGMRTQSGNRPGIRGFLADWWRNALLMVGGVLIIVLIEYIPFFAGIGPGADLLFGSTFGGPFMSILILFVPQVLAFSLLGTYCYRRTGNVYTGAFTIAALACWIVTGGSAML